MERARRFFRRLFFWTRKKRMAAELAEELDLHSQLKRASEPDNDQHRREMGNLTLAREESQDLWGFPRFEELVHDARYAARIFWRSPGFTFVAIGTLALGIAVNTALFSIIDNLLLRPLPFREPQKLVRITGSFPRALFVDLQQKSKTMEIAFASSGSEFNLTGSGPAVRLTGCETSANLFALLGVDVMRGRSFAAEENQPGHDGVVILSESLWKTKFGGDDNVIGKIITLAGLNREVIGIAPTNFAFPSTKVQFWIPTAIDPGKPVNYWAGLFVPLIGRLKPGVTLEEAQTELRGLTAPVWKMFPWPMPRRFDADAGLVSLQTDLAGETRGKLFLLLGAVGAVLLIACGNVASLLLARATSRRKEVAMRAALGAGRFRIIRQLLTESLILALSAGIIGVVMGTASVSLFKVLVPPEIPGMDSPSVDWRVCLFATGLSLLTGLFFGLAPALSFAKVDLLETMRTGSQRSSTKTWNRLRSCLIGAEIALTVILVISAGLLLGSLYGLANADPGFKPQRILTVKISPNDSFCATREACATFYRRILMQAGELPGMAGVAAASTLPFDGETPALAADVENHPRTADFPSPMLWAAGVTPNYFPLMKIPLLAGRLFNDADSETAAPVILITASTAKHFWPGTNPIGKHIRQEGEATWRTIVGVVGDVRQFNMANHAPAFLSGAIYLPYPQSVASNGRIPVAMNLIAMTTGSAEGVAVELRHIAMNADPNVPVGPVMPLLEFVHGSLASYRLSTWMFLSFAAAALILAAIGLYGLISYSVSQRRYEISVRMAIGAKATTVWQMILGQSMRIALAGIAGGLAVSLLVTRLLAGMLVGIATNDLKVFAVVAGLVFCVVTASSLWPAWRASKIDPIKTLRAE